LENLFENIKDKIKIHKNKYVVLHIDLNGVFTKEKFIKRIDLSIKNCLKENTITNDNNIRYDLETFSNILIKNDKNV